MARPLKNRPFGEIESNILKRLSVVFQDPLPWDPKILRDIVKALLARIGERSPMEQRYLESHIRGIASIEREYTATPNMLRRASERRRGELAVLSEEILGSFYPDALTILRVSPTPRYGHAPDTLEFQQAWLTTYLRKYPLSSPPKYDEVAKWLSKNGVSTFENLVAIPCICSYRSSLDDITEKQMTDCRGPAQLIDLLLAEIHSSSPSAIRKILSHLPTK